MKDLFIVIFLFNLRSKFLSLSGGRSEGIYAKLLYLGKLPSSRSGLRKEWRHGTNEKVRSEKLKSSAHFFVCLVSCFFNAVNVRLLIYESGRRAVVEDRFSPQ